MSGELWQVLVSEFALMAICLLMAMPMLLFSGLVAWLVYASHRTPVNPHPPEFVRAMVVAMRSEGNGENRYCYWATFEVPGGHRFEFDLDAKESAQLAEGDRGVLCYKGHEYNGFQHW